MREIFFKHDNNISLRIPETHFGDTLGSRNSSEICFRKIVSLLINLKYIDVNKNILDSGSWVGDNALPWAKMIKGLVFAIDLSENNNSSALEIAKLNDIENIIFYCGALSDCKKTIYTVHDIGHCSLVWNGVSDENTLGAKKIDSFSLDEMYFEGLINNITFLHLDVEGMEYDALCGSSKLIDDCRPIIAYEQHIYTEPINNIINYLKNKNYKVFLINETLANCAPDCKNLIAFPSEKFDNEIIIELDKNIFPGIISLMS